MRICMTTIARITMLTVALTLLGTGCSKQKATKPKRAINIYPNLKVGKVQMGMNRQEVEQAIGKSMKTNDTTSFYIHKGMFVSFDTNGVVFNVKVVKAFEGVTKEGIGIGSKREEVIAAYGKPDEVKPFEDGEDLWYASISINFWVQRGKVTSFIVHF
jgi:hypothetical protein